MTGMMSDLAASAASGESDVSGGTSVVARAREHAGRTNVAARRSTLLRVSAALIKAIVV